jgi:hypothetical protein
MTMSDSGPVPFNHSPTDDFNTSNFMDVIEFYFLKKLAAKRGA